jgi:hypothetical protein
MWIKINFCLIDDCPNRVHYILADKKVCDIHSWPNDWGIYLVSDGKEVSVAFFNLTFCEFRNGYNIIKNNIKYWATLDNINPPKKCSVTHDCHDDCFYANIEPKDDYYLIKIPYSFFENKRHNVAEAIRMFEYLANIYKIDHK